MSGDHHHHNHQHAALCGNRDQHRGDYTPQQQADLDLVLEFNARLAAAIHAGVDVSETSEHLDPDPMRYMWVDEGQGRLREVLSAAGKVLDQAPMVAGHHRLEVAEIAGSTRAARPAVARAGDGSTLCCWVEWVPQRGDVVRAVLTGAGTPLGGAEPAGVSAGVTDVFRPTAAFSADGVPWVLFGSSAPEGVAVWASRYVDGAWQPPEQVTTTSHPSFNQELAAHADGSIELCWQGRVGDRFGIHTRTWRDGAWGETGLVSAGAVGNVWDPAVATFADGSTAYAWSEYHDGVYRVVLRRRTAAGDLLEPRTLTAGTDYALHPSLAVTADQTLWCAFDLITVSGHGGSGPTRLRPAAEVGADPAAVDGMRESGDSVPPELLPEVSATVEVVRVDEHGVYPTTGGGIAPRLDVVPSGLPKLVATADGGLSVTYRIHRKLPLMTYYWEVATQFLGPDGWSPATTYAGTDGPLEEASVCATADGVLVAAQCDGRLGRALQWTEGFGGRECPYLLEHHGSVVWHAVHDQGKVVTVEVASPGAVPAPSSTAAAPLPAVESAVRVEARRWTGRGSRERYTTTVRGQEYSLFWGDLHRHSLVSRCTAGDEPSLEDFYRYSWDVCEYDFWAVTDHSENSSDYQWWNIQKIADLFHIPDRFVPLYGFEWTSADTGHQNVIYGDVKRGAPIFSAFAEGSTDPSGLWESLARYEDYPAITIPHHPGSAMVTNDWDYHDPRYSRLVEIFQACRGNYEAPGAFRQYSDATLTGTFTIDGLKRGHRFGLIGSSDHGHGASYVGAFASSLDRPAVFDALYQRRTFAATTRDVVVDLRMGLGEEAVFMGEETTSVGPRTFSLHAQGYTDLARVDLLRNGEVVFASLPALDLPEGWLAVPVRLEWGESEGTTCWDGELRISGGSVVATDFWSPDITGYDEQHITWANTTKSFGEPYGAQRGDVEVTLVGPAAATVEVSVGERHGVFALADLAGTAHHELAGPVGRFFVQTGIGGLTGHGTSSLDLSFTDDSAEPAFYYARVFQVDGEMAWSSPIWVTPEA